MTCKDRLIELLRDAKKNTKGANCDLEREHLLADYLLENGVIVPPCKVGDVVYIITSDAPSGIEKSRVKRMGLANLQDGMTIKIIVPCGFDDWGKAVWQFFPEDFGKTVFLTKEEAEQALKEGVQE